MKKYSKLMAVLLVFAMILPGIAQAAPVANETTYITVIDQNLRTKNDDTASPVVFVPAGSEVTYVSQTTNGWFKLKYEDKEGFALRGDVTSVDNYNSTDMEIHDIDLKVKANNKEFKTVQDVSLRTGNSNQYRSLMVMPRETVVTHKGTTENGWFKVDFDGQEGYVYRGDVTSTDASGDGNIHELELKDENSGKEFVAIVDLALRTGNSKQYKSVVFVERGEDLKHLGTTENGWFLLENEFGVKGYAYRGDVTSRENYDDLHPEEDIDLAVESLSAISAKALKVTFNKAVVDTAAAKVEVKKGTIKINTSSITWNEDKTEAVIELAGKLTAGDYTVNISGLTEAVISNTVKVEDEKVSKIEILSTEAPLIGTNLQVGYRVLNQYGEDVTKATTITTSAPNVTVTPADGTVLITGTFDTAINKTATFTLIHAASATTATATVTAVSEAKISEVSVVGIYNKDNKEITETSNLSTDLFYVELETKDQYGNIINDPTKVNNELLVTESNPLVIKAAANASVITVDGKKKVVVALSGTPTVGNSIVTLISKYSGKSASTTVTVNEAQRAYNVDIQAPELAVAGETVNLPIIVTDKEGKVITDLNVLTNSIRGIKVTQGAVDKTSSLIVKDGVVVLPTTLSVGYESFVVISNATQKVDTLTVEVKAAAKATTVSGLKSTFSTTLKAGATPDITTANLEVEDQYGRVMTQTQLEAWLTAAATNEVVISSDASNAVITSAAGSVKKNGGSYDAVTVTAGSTNGTEAITIVLKDATGVITSSTKDVTLRVTDGSEYDSYSVDEIGMVYDELANTETNHASYDKEVNVYGVLSDGSKVKLTPGEYNVTSTNSAVATDINANGELNVVTSPITHYTDDNTSTGKAVDTVKVPVSITINATGQKFNQEITFSKVAPKVTKVTVVANGKGADVVADKAVAELTSGNLVATGPFNFAETYGTFADVVVTDQYGAKIVIDGTDAFDDGTAIAAPTLTFAKVSGNVVFANNGLANASVTELPLNSAFKFVLDFAGTKSSAVEVKVTQAYSATAATDMIQANADITTDLAAATAVLNGSTDVATELTLGTATAGSTITWTSNNTGILTNAGVGVNDGVGGTATLTVKVNKTVNGQVGTEQTKAYTVVVNADGTLKSVTP